MPVPVVMVALAGGEGGRVIERGSGREIAACEGGVFFLPAYTPVVVCSGSGEGIRMALAHTNLHWGSLAAPPTAAAPALEATDATDATREGEEGVQAALSGDVRAPSFADRTDSPV